MNGALARYLRRLLALQTIGVLVALTALLQVLDLLDATTDILQRHLGIAGILHYTVLRTPVELALSLPLAMLIGALFTYYTLARSHELIAIQASGLHMGWVVKVLLPVVLVFALLQFLVSDRVMPVAEGALSAWWNSTTLPGDDDDDAPKTLWCHTDDGLVSLDRVSADGRHLLGVRIYRRNADNQLSARVSAASADWENGQWQLRAASELQLQDQHVIRSPPMDTAWKTNLRPDDVLRLNLPQPHLSSTTLFGIVAGQRVGTRPPSYYRTSLYRRIAAPLGLIALLLLALPATRAARRGGEGGGLLLAALGAGLAFVLAEGLMTSLGEGDRVPPLLAAFAPVLMFGTGGIVLLRRYIVS
ncbi:MAG: Lipopolysaccharide export system permease protein [Nevskia sp.]|nr:Lipopolysaccharide export system permease protein [Nevskia sp.]